MRLRRLLIVGAVLAALSASYVAILQALGGPGGDDLLSPDWLRRKWSDREVVPSARLQADTGVIADPAAFQKRPAQAEVGDTDQPQPDAAAPAAAAEAPATVAEPEPASQPPVSQGPVASGASSRVVGPLAPDIHIAGIVGSGRELRVLVVDNVTGARQWTRAGESAFGYRVSYVTTRGAVFERGGNTYVLALGEGAPRPSPAAAPPPPTAAKESSAGADRAEPPSEESKFWGTWTATLDGASITMVFIRGGTGSISATGLGESESDSMTWSVRDGKLRMRTESDPNKDEVKYEFRDNNRTLVLDGPEGLTLRKQ